jgi:DNA-binding transcriptional LysR family regulator
VDLAAGGFDAGIRLGQFIAPDMVAVRLTPPFPFVVVGSPGYLRRRERPERIDDLRQHACLRLRRSNGSIAPWPFANGNKAVEAIVAGPLIAHDYPTLLGAALQGLGLAYVPAPIADASIKAGKLQPLLERFAVTAPGVFLYHPGKRQVLPKLRAFIDHVKNRAADAPSDGTIARRVRKLDVANRA